MNKLKMGGVVLLLIVALSAAGFSLYQTFLVKPDDGLTPAERAAAMKAAEGFSGQPRPSRK